MQYTLGMAKDALRDGRGVFGEDDLAAMVNKAVAAISGLQPWQCLRRTLRFFSAGPCFTLPQGSAGLVRACVNGRPATMRGQDFRFLQSGPGDTEFRPPAGFAPANVVDIGRSAVMFAPSGSFFIVPYADDPAHAPRVTLRGNSSTGRDVRVVFGPDDYNEQPVYSASGALASGDDLSTAVPSSTAFSDVQEASVAVAPEATSYVTLYAADASDPVRRVPLAQYHPRVPVPWFRRYELQGVRPGQPVEILAEVQYDPLPLVADSDVLPFDGIEPVEWMVRSEWAMKSGEASQAEKYRTAAVQWLQAREARDETMQTQILINGVFAGSPGEISMESVNI